MADFTSDMQQSFKSALPYLETDQNMEFMNQFTQLNPTSTDTSSSIFQSLMGFSIDSFLTPQVPEFPGALAESFPAGIFRDDDDLKNVIVMDSMPAGNDFHKCKKRLAIHELDDSCGNSSSHASDDGNKRKNSPGRGKRLKSSENEEEKPKGVVHVRARRGQATDSHSLAERVRRGKINERLKCLQDIVPGCEKTMGMAGMLDEIINYVRSLQNQVDFLSMKLTAASTFHDFNLDTDPMETLQRAKAYEAQKMSQAYEAQRIVRSGYDQELASTQLGPLDFTFGPYPSLQLP